MRSAQGSPVTQWPLLCLAQRIDNKTSARLFRDPAQDAGQLTNNDRAARRTVAPTTTGRL